MKCLIHRDLIYREVVVAMELEQELENDLEDVDSDKNYIETVDEGDAFSWDQVLDDDLDDGIDFIETLEWLFPMHVFLLYNRLRAVAWALAELWLRLFVAHGPSLIFSKPGLLKARP